MEFIKKTVSESRSQIVVFKDQRESTHKENEELKGKVEMMSEENALLNERVAHLKQYTQKENENLREIMNKLGTRLNVSIHDYDISTNYTQTSLK